MKGLLLKEFYSLKKVLIVYPLILVIYSIIGIITNNMGMLVAMVIVLCSSLPQSSFRSDEATKWDVFANTMPVSRKTIVLSKYLFVLITLVLTTALVLIPYFFVGKGGLGELRMIFIIDIVMGSLIISINTPVLIKFGSRTARFIIMGILVVFMILIVGAVGIGLIDKLENAQPMILIAGGIALVAAVVSVSVVLSIKFYERKEF